MRLFIGIPLPAGIRGYLAEIQGFFPKNGLKFVEKDNLHITVKFLGETTIKDKIVKALNKVSFKPFKARLFGLSVFPNERFIKVIHSPVTVGKDKLVELHNLIDKALFSLGFKKDDLFSPHVTIARVKARNEELIKIVNSVKFSDEFIVKSFILYASKLTKQGPVYSVVKEFFAKKP